MNQSTKRTELMRPWQFNAFFHTSTVSISKMPFCFLKNKKIYNEQWIYVWGISKKGQHIYNLICTINMGYNI